MIPVYGQESIGRAWGRDEEGRLDYIEFISGTAGKSENLLVHHQQKLDRKREINWEMENQARIDRIKASLEFMDENKSSETPVEPPPQDFGNDFVPASFLPVQVGETGSDEPKPFHRLCLWKKIPPLPNPPQSLLPSNHCLHSSENP